MPDIIINKQQETWPHRRWKLRPAPKFSILCGGGGRRETEAQRHRNTENTDTQLRIMTIIKLKIYI